jgi:predicted nucleic acid-binding protein
VKTASALSAVSGNGMRVVLDTSVAANIVLQTPAAAGLIAELEQAQLVLAPTLLHSEIANTLWKQVRFGQLGHDDAIGLYHDGIALVDEFVPDHELAIQALSLAVKHQHSAYDMLFVALAQRFGCTLLTVDSKLIAIARKIDATLVRN